MWGMPAICRNAAEGSEQIRGLQEGQSGPVACRSVVLWFDVEFSARFCAEHPVTLSTDPSTQQTHWVQSLLTFKYAAAHPASHCFWIVRHISSLGVQGSTRSCTAAQSLHSDKVSSCLKSSATSASNRT